MNHFLSLIRWQIRLNGLRGATAVVFAMVRRRIFSRPVDEAYCVYRDSFFDENFGVETASVVDVEALDIPTDMKRHSAEYRPTSAVTCAVAIDRLPIRHSEYRFVDIGCGKGRVVIIASLMPFLSVQGVELSPLLAAQARENVGRCEHVRKSGPVEIVEGDAIETRWPREPFVVYLFNPFGEELVRRLESRLSEDLRNAPRDCWVVYANAVCRDVFEHSDHWTAVGRTDGWWGIYRWQAV